LETCSCCGETRAKLTHCSDVDTRRINKRVQMYDNTPLIQGYVTKTDVLYQTERNPKKDYVYLSEACDSVSNVTAVHGAF